MSWLDIKNLWPEPRLQDIPMQFGFGNLKLTIRLPLAARCVPLEVLMSTDEPSVDGDWILAADRQGQFIEGVGGTGLRRGVRVVGERVVYVPYLYERYYVDLRQRPHEHPRRVPAWKAQQILRKQRALRATLEHDLRFVCYERVDQIEEFFLATSSLALGQRGQSFATLPTDATFRHASQSAAAKGRLICYALCTRDTAISYLYCPIVAGSIVYQFLGYDDRYSKFSPGMLLLSSAVQHELKRKRYLYFDFTKGSGQQKRTFATGKFVCADVFILRKTFPSLALTICHSVIGWFMYAIEGQLKRLRLRTISLMGAFHRGA